ncbi:hypothetical protein LCGC14_1149050 [marine sediment metagenome]|uniref:Uncharacterized protein n=1 Tax=marine sediment metagenome TaxID=412755 RepID=A0A0F9LW33_9ZZZZ
MCLNEQDSSGHAKSDRIYADQKSRRRIIRLYSSVPRAGQKDFHVKTKKKCKNI